MDNQIDPLLNPADEVNAENNLLKLKLQLEHGMLMDETTELSAGLENQWLKSVYTFEQQFKKAKPVKLYDYIGRPTFVRWDTLTPDQTTKELQRIELLMENNGVQLDCLCKYDDAIIYKFITEELFQHEMDDMRIAGMTCHFTYEEFYPNHAYDLREQTSRFVKAIFTRPWDEEFDGINLARKVSFSGKDHDRRSISSIMRTFQEAHNSFIVERLEINEVVIDTTNTKANVNARLSVSGKMRHGDTTRYEGICSFRFIKPDDYWCIEDFCIPGFPKKQ
ncbi:MAG: hypothetical protein WD824_09230 [Cyclobacteriaceae bacterium]